MEVRDRNTRMFVDEAACVDVGSDEEAGVLTSVCLQQVTLTSLPGIATATAHVIVRDDSH